MKTSKTPNSIDEYIKTSPKGAQSILKKLQATVRQAAPGAEEGISYQMPVFKFNGKPVVYFAVWKEHIGFYALPSGNKAFKKELSKYDTAKGSIKFPLDQPMPWNLIKKMVQHRMKELKSNSIVQPYTHYHKDGSIWAKGKTAKGKMEGYWEWFRKDGTIMRSGYFKNEVQVGEWTTYDSKGRIARVTNFNKKIKK